MTFNKFDDGDTEGANVNIVDSDNPQNKTKVRANKDLATGDLVSSGGLQSSLTVGTTPVEVKVGSSRLTDRKSVTLFNDSNATLYWGYTDSVTVSSGSPILKNQLAAWAISEDVSVYVVAGSANNNTRITEGA
jgi:hypothetical protein